ncbi:hypothetical protein QUV98_03860 [Massilimicrobiota timonensis]|uniref:Conjugal transfer protein n=1 Tax=Massilimicrobiota timonensis TaxID=1776392 RepID=A0ABT7UH49_9FIRM|nr:hypothetical protein [Massilimicrobiota timonensis]MDM8195453.1 hypothetical protein [Massilimicrobiota timonensis]
MNKKVKQVNYKALLFGALIGGISGLYLYNINLISYIFHRQKYMISNFA